MDALTQLFAARLVMNEDRNKAMELAQGDLLLLGKVNIQIQDEIKKLEKPIDNQPEPIQPEKQAEVEPIKIDANYRDIVEKIMSAYGPVGQKILIEINKQCRV